MNRYENACFTDVCLPDSWQKKDKKDEVICILRKYILLMYVYYKGDDLYRVMLLVALTLQSSHISVDSESLPVCQPLSQNLSAYDFLATSCQYQRV